MVFESYGEPEIMRLRDAPVPEPQDSEVLIRVGYAGVNPSDSKARAGYNFTLPFVTGVDAAGVVERNGGERNRIQTRGSRDHLVRTRREDLGQLC